MLIIGVVDAKRMRIKDVENLLAHPTQVATRIISVDQDAIIKRLDEQLSSPVEAAWDDRVDDLFNLATVNPELARSYFKKMSEKMVITDVKPIEVVVEKPAEKPTQKEEQKEEQKIIVPEKNQEPQKVIEEKEPSKVPVIEKPIEPTLPVGEKPMEKSTRPAPPRKFGPKPEVVEGAQGETAQVPSDNEAMKPFTRPAPPKKGGAPSGGPKKTLIPSSSAKATTPGSVEGKKEVAPKKVEQIFSGPKLQQLSDDKLVELFNELLDKLRTDPRSWNAMDVVKMEEKTKYGSKTYNLYGAPIAKWTNDINTLKKVLVSKNIMSEAQVTQTIAECIAQVRSEKKSQQVVSKEQQEKPQEELTGEDLAKLIKAQLTDPKPTEIGWVVSIKGNIKALDKINHEEALKYHDQFIKITKEKPFLK